MIREQLARNVERRPLRIAVAEDDCEELGVGQRCRAVLEQPLTRTLRSGPCANRTHVATTVPGAAQSSMRLLLHFPAPIYPLAAAKPIGLMAEHKPATFPPQRLDQAGENALSNLALEKRHRGGVRLRASARLGEHWAVDDHA